MAGAIKQSTYLTGMQVSANPKNVLNKLYKRIMGLVEKMPAQSAYRKYTEEVVKHRSQIINSTEDVCMMEEKIGCGQIEEVIIQARNELELAQSFILTRPWESLITPIPKNQWKWPVK